MAKTEVVFESNISHLELVRQRKAQMPLPTGGWHTTQKTVDYKFQPAPSPRTENGWCGLLRVKEGQDKLSTDDEGWLAPGEEVGVERDAVKALMAHRSFGTRFWIVGHAPGTLYPRPQDLRKSMRLALTALDEEALANLLAEERRAHQRAELLTELEESLALVREERARLEAEQAAAEAKAPKAKPKAPAAA